MSATVLAAGKAAPGASVTFTITRPGGTTIIVTTVTDYYGVASYSLRLRSKDPAGVYQVNATATSNGATGTGAASFTVK